MVTVSLWGQAECGQGCRSGVGTLTTPSCWVTEPAVEKQESQGPMGQGQGHRLAGDLRPPSGLIYQ